MKGEILAERLNLYQKLAKIRKIAGAVVKDKKGYGYTYTDITQILAKVTAGMEKYNVSLIPQIVPGTSSVIQNVVINTKVDKAGNTYENKSTEMLFCADMVYKWINDDNPEEFIEVPWFVTGAQSDPSQSEGSGLTYTSRQFLTNFFQIAQVENDVDAYRSKQKEAEVSEEKAIAGEIISQVDQLIKTYLADHQDEAEAVKKFVSKYAKNANYLGIKEPKLAAKLLEDFKTKFKVKDGD